MNDDSLASATLSPKKIVKSRQKAGIMVRFSDKT